MQASSKGTNKTTYNHSLFSSTTLLWRGVSVTLKGTGDLPESPSYSFRSIGSSGSSVIENAQSILDIARNTSFSVRSIPIQIRRLLTQQSRVAVDWFETLTLSRTSNDHVCRDQTNGHCLWDWDYLQDNDLANKQSKSISLGEFLLTLKANGSGYRTSLKCML